MGKDLSFEKYEKDCKQIREENQELLRGFAEHLHRHPITFFFLD